MRDQANSRIYLAAPHMSGSELEYINQAFESNWIAPLGPHVDAFETETAAVVGMKAGAALSSGTAAIHLALRLLDVTQNDTVLCSTLTFAGGANPILYEKARPVFVDSEPQTWGMSPDALEKALETCSKRGESIKAVIVANLYGQSADFDRLLPICHAYNVPIIEDAAESLGASYKGKPSGSFGRLSILSFNGNKIITTSGGGMLLSDDVNLIEKARFLASQARDPAPHYQHSQIGYNYRLSNVLAAIGRAQLTKLTDRVKRKQEIFSIYASRLGGHAGVSFMPQLENTSSNRWLTTMLLDPSETSVTPQDIMSTLSAQNIESRPIWKPMHLQPLYSRAPYFTANGASVSDEIFARGLCLPSSTALDDSVFHRICDTLESRLFVKTKLKRDPILESQRQL